MSTNLPVLGRAKAWFDHRRGADGQEPGCYISLGLDDGYTQQVADIAFINSLGLNATLFLTRGWVDLAGTNATWHDTYITSAQVTSIVAAGNEISYHDNGNHVGQPGVLASLGPDGFQAYVASYKAWALANWGVTVTTGAYPAGLSDTMTREVIARELMFVRGTKGVPARNPPHPQDVPGYDILTIDEATIKAKVDAALAARQHLSLLWHGGADAAFRTKLGNVIAYAQSLGIPIGTFKRGMEERTLVTGSGHMIDAQGNAFHPQVRTYTLEVTRDDTISANAYFGIDETSNAPYFDADGGTTWEARKKWSFLTGALFPGGSSAPPVVQPSAIANASSSIWKALRSAAETVNPGAIITELRYGFGWYTADAVTTPGTITGGIVAYSSGGQPRWKGATPPSITGSTPATWGDSLTSLLVGLGLATDARSAYVPAASADATYRFARERASTITASFSAGNRILTDNGANAAVTGTAAGSAATAFYLDPADYLVTDKTTQLRMGLSVQCNDVAPGCDFAVSLRPWTSPTGANGVVAGTTGTAITGSTATVTAPAANSQSRAVSTDFGIPAAGWYVFGLNTSATTAVSSTAVVRAVLQAKNV